MKERIFNCGRYKDAAKSNKTQKELSNYTLRSSEKSRLDVAKSIRNLNTKDLMPTAPSKADKQFASIKKDVWIVNYRTQN